MLDTEIRDRVEPELFSIIRHEISARAGPSANSAFLIERLLDF